VPYRIIVQNNPVNWIDPFGLKPGDLFPTQDAAAIDAIDFTMKKSSREDREYGGFIYNDSTGRFSYTSPQHGDQRSMDVNTFKCPPAGTNKTAIYHTHPGSGYNVPYFSTDDYLVSNIHRLDIYLGTESGLIKEWDPVSDGRTIRQPFK
jgi:hypothetical protein